MKSAGRGRVNVNGSKVVKNRFSRILWSRLIGVMNLPSHAAAGCCGRYTWPEKAGCAKLTANFVCGDEKVP
jgi:hypothetical protein